MTEYFYNPQFVDDEIVKTYCESVRLKNAI